MVRGYTSIGATGLTMALLLLPRAASNAAGSVGTYASSRGGWWSGTIVATAVPARRAHATFSWSSWSWSSHAIPRRRLAPSSSSSSSSSVERTTATSSLARVIPSSGIDDDRVGGRERNDVAADDDSSSSSMARGDPSHRRDHLLQRSFPFPLDRWQLDAGRHILDGRNVIVCAPTGAGKTVVGEMALRIALDRNTRGIYTTPLKALSNQKFGEMRGVFGVDRVGLATGDVSIRRGADVTIMTTEVYRNMAWRARTGSWDVVGGKDVYDGDAIDGGGFESARLSSSLSSSGGDNSGDEYSDLSSNSIVVLDEFHYMGQKGRGSTWEECVIFNPMHTQIVGLSATLREFLSYLPYHCPSVVVVFFISILFGGGDFHPFPSSCYCSPPSSSHTTGPSFLSHSYLFLVRYLESRSRKNRIDGTKYSERESIGSLDGERDWS